MAVKKKDKAIKPNSMKKYRKKREWSKLNYIYYFLFVIIASRLIVFYLKSNGEIISAEITNSFAFNFIEWSGILYSIAVSSIIVKVWEILDSIDREFDREATAIRLLYEDLKFLRGKNKTTSQKISTSLRSYTRHVVKKYSVETTGLGMERIKGDEILINIRKQFYNLISLKERNEKPSELLVGEFFQRIDEIIDLRGNRVALASQRLFSTFRVMNLIASILFLLPFYIVGSTIQTTILDNILIVGVTLSVIFVYLVIEDFDEPFGGTWKIDNESWHLLRRDMVCEERKRRLKKMSKKEKWLHKAE
mgnify:CR=1 FL=1